MSRNYHAEIVEATMSGDVHRLAALAHEFAGMAQEAARLEEAERERKAHHAEWKRNRRQRPSVSTDVHGQSRTDVDAVDEGSPLVPPSPLPAPNTPPPFNPPSQVPRRSAARGEKRPPVTGSRRPSWLEPAAASWEAKFGAGSFAWGEGGKALKPLEQAGHEPEEIAKRLTRYLAKTETQFASIHRFAKTFGEHGPLVLKGPEVVDFWMSPEVERLTRSAGSAGYVG